MPEITFVDSSGQEHCLPVRPDETIRKALLGHELPPTAVVVFNEGRPVPPTHVVEEDESFLARPVEGYGPADLARSFQGPAPPTNAVHVQEWLSFERESTDVDRTPIGESDVTDYFERVVAETLSTYGMIPEGNAVIIGLSDGSDSTALLSALSEAVPSAELHTVTVAEPWAAHDPRPRARELVADYDVVHHDVSPVDIERQFNLAGSAADVFDAIRADKTQTTLGAADHVVSTFLEKQATDVGTSTVCLGSNATDLLAGLLSSITTGAETGSPPVRPFGPFEYVYPFCFLSRKEIILYNLAMNAEAEPPTPEPWDKHTVRDRLHYHVASILQSIWPGIEYWMIENSHGGRNGPTDESEVIACENCGKRKLQETMTDKKYCGLCGFLDESSLLA